jgi:hypothetical protein
VRTLVLLTLSLCAGRARAETPEAALWGWVTAHAAELAKVKSAGDPVTDPLAERLRAIHPSLVFELALPHKGPHELVISADGDRAAFPAVQRVVAAAPKIAGWKVTAFRPRAPSAAVEFQGVRLDPRTVRFLAMPPREGKVSIAIFAPGPIAPRTQHAVYLLLDAVLGEYDVETRLAGIEIVDDKRALPQARPLAELASVVDALKR